jgi:RNA polymerase sigma-70 factor (ECF subfamily)
MMKTMDVSAFEEFYDQTAPLVLAVCARILSDRVVGEDCLVEVFANGWDHAEQFGHNRAALMAHILKLARTTALSRRDAGLTGSSAIPYVSASSGTDAFASLRLQVRQALHKLDPPQRQAMEFCYFDGLSHREISERLDKPVSTVRTIIRQALLRVRDALRSNPD